VRSILKMSVDPVINIAVIFVAYKGDSLCHVPSRTEVQHL